MAKFSKGDKARVISVDDEDVKAGVKVGDIVTVAEDNTAIPFCVMSNGGVVVLIQDQIEHYIEPPKEITQYGATYVLKEEQKPDHEWKFGDWARHPKYGVVFVVTISQEFPKEIWVNPKEQIAGVGCLTAERVNASELTYISSATIPE